MCGALHMLSESQPVLTLARRIENSCLECCTKVLDVNPGERAV
jgi:hypothetical protein